MHPKNIHKESYNLQALCQTLPSLTKHLQINKHGKETINFSNPDAVLILNKALLAHHYNIDYWEFPDNYLCPPIPGRVNYIHTAADLLKLPGANAIPKGNQVVCLDIGTGANCIYPLLGGSIHQWKFVASEIDQKAMDNAKTIIAKNDLDDQVELRFQQSSEQIFKSLILKDELYALSFCNPPFYSSQKEADQSSLRKQTNLGLAKNKKPQRNFGGQSHELWCEGGEKQFIHSMIKESASYKYNCLWFTSLVSQEKNLKSIEKLLRSMEKGEYRILPMHLGNKKSRIIAWTFFNSKQREKYLHLLNA